MIVNSNPTAKLIQRYLHRAASSHADSMKKLASGSRINSAKDDAAGLQISNRLQAQRSGFEVATRNASDAISMLQTAEGAMAEYTDNLMRMRDLTLQYAGGVNSSEDHDAIRQEFNALKDELKRITETTSFGGQRLLNGSNSSRSFQVGASSGEAININLPNLDSIKGNEVTSRTIYCAPIANRFADAWESLPDMKIGAYIVTYHPDRRYETETEYMLAEPKIGSSFQDVVNELNEKYGDKATFYLDYSFEDTLEERDVGNADKLRLCFYPHDETAYMHFQYLTNTPSGLGRNPFYYAGGRSYKENVHNELEIPTLNEGGQAAIDSLDQLLEFIDSERARLGAAQNRLSHAINNLSQSSENIAASNSRIRDTDFARETSRLAKESIFKEANTAMLTLASKAPQEALYLLK